MIRRCRSCRRRLRRDFSIGIKRGATQTNRRFVGAILRDFCRSAGNPAIAAGINPALVLEAVARRIALGALRANRRAAHIEHRFLAHDARKTCAAGVEERRAARIRFELELLVIRRRRLEVAFQLPFPRNSGRRIRGQRLVEFRRCDVFADRNAAKARRGGCHICSRRRFDRRTLQTARLVHAGGGHRRMKDVRSPHPVVPQTCGERFVRRLRCHAVGGDVVRPQAQRIHAPLLASVDVFPRCDGNVAVDAAVRIVQPQSDAADIDPHEIDLALEIRLCHSVHRSCAEGIAAADRKGRLHRLSRRAEHRLDHADVSRAQSNIAYDGLGGKLFLVLCFQRDLLFACVKDAAVSYIDDCRAVRVRLCHHQGAGGCADIACLRLCLCLCRVARTDCDRAVRRAKAAARDLRAHFAVPVADADGGCSGGKRYPTLQRADLRLAADLRFRFDGAPFDSAVRDIKESVSRHVGDRDDAVCQQPLKPCARAEEVEFVYLCTRHGELFSGAQVRVLDACRHL